MKGIDLPGAESTVRANRRGRVFVAFAGILGLLLLYVLSRYNYLLFHSVVELFSIFIALAIFVSSWNTRKWSSNHFLLFLGIAYLFVALVDIAHALSYKGMGVFPTTGANEATQFWILARFIEAFSLLIAPLFVARRIRIAPTFATYATVSGFGLLAVGWLGIVPDCFIEGEGLTAFKVISEYVISGILLGAIINLRRYKDSVEPRIVTLLTAAMVTTIAGELAFTLYTDVYGVLNVAGHLFKMVSFYLIYRATVVSSLTRPYELLFHDLVKAKDDIESERDVARRYLDVAGVMIVALDAAGRIVVVNRKAAEILGYSEAELIGKDWIETFRPESERENAREALRLLMTQATKVTDELGFSETTVLTRSGEERTIAWHDTIAYNTDGTSIGTLSSGEDITVRLRAESALHQSEQEYRSLFEQSLDAIWLLKPDGTDNDVNQAWLDLFGYNREDIASLNAADVYANPVDRKDFLRRMAETGHVRDEIRFKRKNGTEFDCERAVVALKDASGRIVRFQGITRDITQQKQSARTLAESEHKYRLLFEQSMDAICLVSPGGQILEANQAYLNLFGYSGKEIAALNVEGQYVDTDGRTNFLEWMTSHDALMDDEVQFRKKDGTTIDCLHSAVTRRAEDGSSLGYQSVIRDITARKRTEEGARQSRDVQAAVNTILRLSLEEVSLTEILERSLDTVLFIPWLALESRGSIFVVEEEPDVLVMKAQRGLAPPLQEACARVPFGRCLCGRAALTGKVQFADCLDSRHEITYQEITEHGHYCIPITSGGEVLGVINVYVREGHLRNEREEEFLSAVANTMAGVVGRKRAEQEMRESEMRFRSLVENTGAAVLVTRPDGTILDCNHAALQMLGYPREGLLKVPLLELFNRVEEREAVVERFGTDGFVKAVEVELKRRDESPLYVQMTSANVPLRGETVIMTEFLDITERKIAHQQLEDNNVQLEQALRGTLEAIQQMVEARDPYTSGHQRRVAELSTAIARQMHLPEESCVSPIQTAALLHDIGKITIPAEILSKPGRLTAAEFSLVKSHVRTGYDLISRTQLPTLVADAVLQHHERLDGSGYPQGLTGDEILPEAQILAVADVVEAMCSHRPYRPALGVDAALEEISAGRGKLYDPDVVDACLAVFRDKGFAFTN